jgi:hypothetical protein
MGGIEGICRALGARAAGAAAGGATGSGNSAGVLAPAGMGSVS